ncbi:hypothetical protein KTAU_31160 [Thermogemmatispora aurantia]|uniref:hypothetical protein n=1 Tax=Thermogemmatispora aurantia TaxID=2045279 RepID=UPI00124E5CCD|nr:hypothetical protein [Thermogemmatispora aurantia]GER84480.1 hypothetical protein KTAU_31160 [Thermogemmatispora aurantia]
MIGDFLKALVTIGVSGATDPRTWTLTGQALAHPWLAGGIIVFAGLLTFAAFRADVTKRRTAEEAARRKRKAEAQAERERAHLPYVVKRVETLDPGAQPDAPQRCRHADWHRYCF